MKIAVITDDGTKVSQHFGRAPYYIVFTVENGKIIQKERRNKAGHHSFGTHKEEHPSAEQRHGYDSAAQARHETMANTISDCQVLIAGGMGWGAYESLKSRGIEVIVTDVTDTDEAVKKYTEGNLINKMERLH